MTLKTKKWDVLEHLKTEADRSEFIEACLDEACDDVAFISAARLEVERSRGEISN